jgi:ABC-2 type transport system ATP-binding protein
MTTIAPETTLRPDPAPSSLDADAAVRLDDVSVRYRVPHERIPSLKEYVIRRIRGRLKHQDFWALQGISLTIQKGEVFGVIGRNGAGKSTLLKTVARVLRPTRGRVRVRGRVVPLLEMGAGFQPELTGIENIYLNATLLGRRRTEIEDALEGIVKFAEIGDFIDAPLRTYSTGMVMRLGFAVATAWNPDVLLVDEILGVGDEGFQRKCEDRIKAFRKSGATILFVSHAMAQVQSICSRVLWLDGGVARHLGDSASAVQAYTKHP